MEDDKIKIPQDIKKLKFEDAMAELEEIVRTLEQGQQSLDTSIDAWTRAMQLRKHCENLLAEAKLKVEKLIPKADGNHELSDFDG
ncbi:MAG: exodeoxyribonuclease VII small subunit [Alphaproteobacteria bacterium]